MSIMTDFIRSLFTVLLLQIIIISFAKICIISSEKIKNFYNDLPKNKDTLSLPHPPNFPIIKNLLQLIIWPLDKLNQWSDKYGPIYGVHLGQKFFIILNNHEVVNDLIVKCGSNYSSKYNLLKVIQSL